MKRDNEEIPIEDCMIMEYGLKIDGTTIDFATSELRLEDNVFDRTMVVEIVNVMLKSVLKNDQMQVVSS